MSTRVCRLLLAALLLCALSPTLAAPAKGVKWETDGKHVNVLVNWCEVVDKGGCAPSAGKEQQPRITTESAVKVSVSSFNFLHYNVEYAIEEKEIAAYAYLAGIWDQILGFDLTKQLGISGSGVDWWKEIRTQRELLQKRVAEYANSPALSQADLDKLKGDRDIFLKKITQLDLLRAKAFEDADSVEELQKFDIVDKDHQALVAALTTFADLAQRSLQGDTKNIGNKKAGTYVTVSINAKPLTTASNQKAGSARAEYLVESKFPLLFHAGLTYNKLKDTKFETVRALEGRDLFVKVRDEDSTETFSVYLSYPLDDRSVDQAKWFGTLGTDLKELGDNIYVGASYRIKGRWFLSIGGVYGLQTEGENPTTEGTAQEPSRTLYEIIKEEREWKGFASVSVKLY
jgi:hypothetical protein